MNTLYTKIVNDNYLCLDCATEQDGVLVDVAQERNEYSYVCVTCHKRKDVFSIENDYSQCENCATEDYFREETKWIQFQ